MFNSGYTEGSNYAVIAVDTIRDALNTIGQNGDAYVAANSSFIQQGAAAASGAFFSVPLPCRHISPSW